MPAPFGHLPQQIAALMAPDEDVSQAADVEPEAAPPAQQPRLLPETRKGVGRDMLATIERIRGEAQTPSVNPLLATVMVGSALSANTANERRMAEKASALEAKSSVTMNADGTFTAKNVPGADFVDAAKKQSAGTLAAVYATLEQFGRTPKTRADDPELDNGMTYDEVYQGAIELGASPRKARRQTEIIMRDPKLQAEAARVLRVHRSRRDIAEYQSLRPVISDLEQADARDQRTVAEVRRSHEQFLSNNLLDLGTEDDAAKIGRQRIEAAGGKWNEAMEAEVRSSYRGQRTKATTEQATFFNSALNQLRDEDVRGYAANDADEFIANAEADIGRLTAAQKIRLRKRFEGLHEEIAERGRREERAEARLHASINKASTEKPAKIASWQAKDMTVESLAATIGDPLIDQTTAKLGVNARLGDLRTERQTLNAKHQQIVAEHKQVKARIASVQKRLTENEYAPHAQTEMDTLEKRRIQLESEALGINAKLKPIISGMQVLESRIAQAHGAGAAPTVGETKTFPNGKKGKWDGQGWVMVP